MACVRLAATCVLVAILGIGRPALAQSTATEESVTAAFLLNFARFTEWPADAASGSAPLVMCVADQGVAEALETAARGRQINGRRLDIRRIEPDASLRPCAVLFVGRSAKESLPGILSALAGASVLTVSDADAFAERGGVIQLFLEDGRMRFAINVQAAKAARLALSAQLLSLARIVGK